MTRNIATSERAKSDGVARVQHTQRGPQTEPEDHHQDAGLQAERDQLSGLRSLPLSFEPVCASMPGTTRCGNCLTASLVRYELAERESPPRVAA
jgi:hypothetical protein